MPRNTKTGGVLEQMIIPALGQGGYKIKEKADIGKRPGGKKHELDVMAEKENKRIFISLKWQQTPGTAEQKIPFEIICLAKAVKEHRQRDKKTIAYLVLGGPDQKSWTLRDFFIGNGLDPYLHPDYVGLVKILKTDDFIALANKGGL